MTFEIIIAISRPKIYDINVPIDAPNIPSLGIKINENIKFKIAIDIVTADRVLVFLK